MNSIQLQRILMQVLAALMVLCPHSSPQGCYVGYYALIVKKQAVLPVTHQYQYHGQHSQLMPLPFHFSTARKY